ncbi:VOC family protein [Mycolicibacterium setense]
MPNRWSGVTIDCADPLRMSTFWAALLSIPASSEHGDDPNWATVGSRSGPFPRLTFQRVPEPKTTKVRIHLDVQVDDIAEGLVQVEALGGRWAGTRNDYDEGVVVVMLDPEGHEFCLVQYFEDHASEVDPESVRR